jgi:hypothetical protein
LVFGAEPAFSLLEGEYRYVPGGLSVLCGVGLRISNCGLMRGVEVFSSGQMAFLPVNQVRLRRCFGLYA